MQRELAELHRALVAAVDPGAHMDGAFDKLFSRLANPNFPLRLLPPYTGATDAAFERFAATLRERFPAWWEAPIR